LKKSSLIFGTITGYLLIIFSCAPASKSTYLLNTIESKGYEEKVEEYKLQPGDLLRIDVVSLTEKEFDIFKDESTNNNNRQDPLLTGYLIDANGYLSLPFVGDVLVQRLTVREVREKIKLVLSDYLESPVVNVRMISFHYTVLGEVKREGKFEIYEDRVNLLEAIGSAGGVTQFANFEQVKILRTEDGVSTSHQVNLLDGDLPSSEFYYLRPNDVVVVDQSKNKNFRLNSSRNISLILGAIATSLTIILAVDNLSN